MTGTNGTGPLIDKHAAMKILGLSHSHFDRLVRRGDLPVARRVDRGYPKPLRLFDPEAVEALRIQRSGERIDGEPHPEPAPASPPPPTAAQLIAAVKALHGSQVVILEALQQPCGVIVEAELWHSLLTLTRGQERILAEGLLGVPLPLGEGEEASDHGHP
jgi:predicted DNA-binding transcriptional regulator AlpA